MEVACAASDVEAWRISNITYWKSYRYKIEPPEPFTVTVFVRLVGVSFVDMRTTDAQRVRCFSPKLAVCHHLSYARTDQEVLNKITRFSHCNDIREDWFTDVWQGWDHNHQMEHLHPVVPAAYRRAVPQDPKQYPPVLRKLYERHRTFEREGNPD